MHRRGAFGHTLRAVKIKSNWTERLEGDSLRYTAIAALGLSYIDRATQQTDTGWRYGVRSRTCVCGSCHDIRR